MAVVESAWERYPGYRIDLVPVQGTARVWHGERLLASSTDAVRLIETDHVERLYLPESDVRWDLIEPSEHHTVCPFKGQADYWSVRQSDAAIADVFWTYRHPFPEVAGIEGFLGVYDEKVRVEVETRWEAEGATSATTFPAWGDESDLLRLIDAQPDGTGGFTAPGYHERTRNVVEGGQLLAQALVAATKTVPDQRLVSAYATFPRVATFDEAVDLRVEPLRFGRRFSTLSVRGAQADALVCPALVLLGAETESVVEDRAAMPDVAGPLDSEPYDMRVIGRAVRVVDGAYSPDPDRTGPPELNVWLRFRDDPADPGLRRALLTQATTHWTVAAALRPHPGVGEADAHVSLSTGIVSVAVAFHDDAPLDRWILYANRATWSGRGLCRGEGQVFSEDGLLLASYSVEAMIQRFDWDRDVRGRDPTTVL